MDPKRLLIFGAVARSGSLAAAARDLGWTQPAVSQHVRALEREAGLPLLVRGPRGIVPTQAGLVLLAHADAVQARLRTAEAELQALATATTGTVRVATFPTAGATLLPAALALLAERHPGLDVRLTEAEPPQALALLGAGQVDLALVFRHDDEPAVPAPGLVEHLLADDPVRLVLPPGHPGADRPRLRLTDLREERWVGGCVRCREHLLRACSRAGFAADVRHSTDDYVIVQALVAQGLAVALLPDLALRSLRRPGIEVRDVAGAGYRRIIATHHVDASTTPALRALLTALIAGRSAPESAPGSAPTSTPGSAQVAGIDLDPRRVR